MYTLTIALLVSPLNGLKSTATSDFSPGGTSKGVVILWGIAKNPGSPEIFKESMVIVSILVFTTKKPCMPAVPSTSISPNSSLCGPTTPARAGGKYPF